MEGKIINQKSNIQHQVKIAIAGNPNSGKTTIFNELTGARQHVGNWPGVTVEKKTGEIERNGKQLYFTDLPGIYSISTYSQEEIIAREFITKENPDVVIDVVDASNLERNLYLATQLIEFERPLIIVLNMMDVAEEKGLEIDTEKLSILLGAPVVPVVGRSGKGVEVILEKIDRITEHISQKSRHIHIEYNRDIEEAIEKIEPLLQGKNIPENDSRWKTIKLLEQDAAVHSEIKTLGDSEILEQTKSQIEHLEKRLGKFVADEISDAKYGFIQGAIRESVKQQKIDKKDISKSIDLILTNRFLGLPIFTFFMWAMFKLTFGLGEIPMNWIDSLVGMLGETMANLLPDGSLLQSLVVDGIIAGVGGIAIFLPNIFILFFIIALFEDSGYMARVAFIMDRIMHTIGLHGKAFIPMVMGFGCNVPAVMGARILESRRDQILTVLINPFMSCAARLPVYVLIAGAFFPNHAGNAIFAMYILGIAMAILTGKLFSKTILKGKSLPFVMELPPYHPPKIRSILLHTWDRGSIFIKKMGGVILVGSILVWSLSAFPQEVSLSKNYESEIVNTKDLAKIEQLQNEMEAEKMEKKWIGKIGKIIEPTIAPLGFDWRDGVALVTGFVAKEIVVSTYGVLYGVGTEKTEDSPSLREKLAKSGMTAVAAFGFMIFTLIYTPCLATVAAIKRETSWKWAGISIGYSLALAWVMAFLVKIIGGLFVG